MGIGDIANSGMQAAMSNMEVISNNIANANTIGFKRSYANFADIFPSTNGAAANQIGVGVEVSSVLQDFGSGAPSPTGNTWDLSINNTGFFILRNPNNGQVSYTRAGRFLPVSGYIMSGTQRLQGFAASNNTIPPGSPVGDLQINTSPLPAVASTQANVVVNVSSNDVAPTSPFNASDETTYNNLSEVNVYDSLGNTHTVTSYYVKLPTPENTWNVYVSVDGNVINGSTPGTLTFNDSGTLTSATGLTATDLSFAPGTGAASPQSFAINMAGSTQVSTPDAILTHTANGNPPSTYNYTTVDTSGMVWLNYSNNQQVLAGQVALADFQSPQSLTDIGNMQWIANSESGNPVVTQNNSTLNISTGYVELSNVDLTTEMVNLLNAQHTFQANAQVEQSYNEVMNTVIQL